MSRALFAYNPSSAYVWAVSLYAENMIEDPRAYLGYWHWAVRYRHVDGVVELPEGWPTVPAVPVGASSRP
jgi:hypothetical protein